MTDKQFCYRQSKDNWYYQFLLLAIIGLFGYIEIREIFRLTTNYSGLNLVILLIGTLIISTIIYIQYQIIRMRKEYELVDRNKVIIINNKERKIIIRQHSSEMTLTNENIESAELFESWNATYPLGLFSFIKLKTKTGENITITGFTIPLLESELKSVLKGIKMKYHRQFINRIE